MNRSLKSVNSNFARFDWLPYIFGYSPFCDRSQDGASFRDTSEDEIWPINETVVLTITNFGLSVFTGR